MHYDSTSGMCTPWVLDSLKRIARDLSIGVSIVLKALGQIKIHEFVNN